MLYLRGRLYSLPYRTELLLLAVALLSRLPLLSISIDEVDSANFVNALTHGYDIPQLRPHPPGYPVYVFMGRLVNAVVGDPLRSLTLLSAVSGSLAVVPLYWLLSALVAVPLARIGAACFLAHPLVWALSETALADAPSLFLVVLLAWLSYRGLTDDRALLASGVVVSLAIGVRQGNVALLALPAFPMLYRRLVLPRGHRHAVAGAIALFAITSAAWVVPMILFGSNGWDDYSAAVAKQWSTAIRVYDWMHVQDPWLVNVLWRLERFAYAYFLTYSWSGDDAKTALTLALAVPWAFGFSLFILSFRWRSIPHLFVAVWLATIAYVSLTIHFLPRYALPQVPAFLIACLIGYAFLGRLRSHPRWIEILSITGIGTTLVLYGIKYQPPVGTFEYTPPAGSALGGVLVTAGIAIVLLQRHLYWRNETERSAALRDWHPARGMLAAGWALALLIGIYGYTQASIAHRAKSPTQRLVEFVGVRFAGERITPCWDNLTHSTFEVLIPGARPAGFWSIDELFHAHDAGRILIVTDKCPRLHELRSSLTLVEVGKFEGRSPVWSKAPALRVYATPVTEISR